MIHPCGEQMIIIIGKRYGSLVIKIALVAVVVFLLMACSQSSSAPENPCLKILKHQMTVQNFVADSPSSVAVVSGSAVNESNQLIETASIKVVFYNEGGAVVDVASATASNLVPGVVWNFSVQSSGTEAWKITRYDISADTDG